MFRAGPQLFSEKGRILTKLKQLRGKLNGEGEGNMRRFSGTWKKWLYPGWPWVIALAIGSGALLTLVFGKNLEETPLAYGTYVLSAYALAAVVAQMVETGKTLRRKLYAAPLTRRYLTDAFFRVRVGLWFSFGLNLAYAGFKLLCAARDSSFWDGALGLYYFLLCGVRMHLIRKMPVSRAVSEERKELGAYRAAGIFLMLLDLALGGIAVQIVRHGHSYHYAGTLVFAAGFYAFYCLIHSGINTVKYRKFNSPVLSAAKAVNLTTALVSIFSLETALLDQFGEDGRFREIMTAATACTVCMLVLAIAVYMVIRSGSRLRQGQKT